MSSVVNGIGGGMEALRSRALILAAFSCAVCVAGSVFAAAPPSISAPVVTHQDEELDEVSIDGVRPTRKPSDVITWMRRLVGQFAYQGYIDLGGQGNPEDQHPVRGQADCVGFGVAPAVQCEIRVLWAEVRGADGEEIPGGVSNLNPAMILFGFEPDEVGIRFMQVDNKGIAEPALGRVVGDTLVSRAPCVNQPGNCERVTRITAEPDLRLIQMHVDIEVDYRRSLGYRFVMRRVPEPTPVQ